MQAMPNMNDVKPTSNLPPRAPDGRYRIALLKAYPHVSGFNNSLLSVVEFVVKEIREQRPTIQQSTQNGVKKEQTIGTVVVGDIRAYKINMTDKSGPGDWRKMLEQLAAHPEVKEDVKNWNEFSEQVMGKGGDNAIEDLEFELEINSKITGRGNTFGVHRFSYPQ